MISKTNKIKILRTTGKDPRFQDLVIQLDSYLSVINGEEDHFFREHNSSYYLKHVVLVFCDDQVVACGAFKEYSPGVIEIKRMFVRDTHRKIGLAGQVLTELLEWGKSLHYTTSILETARSMIPAVNFYSKFGFRIIENYGPYIAKESSICFEKHL